LLLIVANLIAIETVSQDTIPENKNGKLYRNFLQNDGKWTIEIPIWIPGFRGEFAYGDISLEGEDGVDPKPDQPIEKPRPGDIFKRLFKTSGNLNFVFMSRISFNSGKIYAQVDGFSGSVGSSTVFRYNNTELIKARFSTNLYRFFAGYEIIDTRSKSDKIKFQMHPYLGIRFNDINLNAQLGKSDDQLSAIPLWVEPIFGVKNALILRRWSFVLNGDLGYWADKKDKEDKLSYMINFTANFRISNLISVKAGWSDWNTNYKNKVLGEDLKLKMNLSGPSAALTFHF
jgi:hypothetical protein